MTLSLDSIPNGRHEFAVFHVGPDIEDTLLLVEDLIPSADDQNDVAWWNHDAFLVNTRTCLLWPGYAGKAFLTVHSDRSKVSAPLDDENT